MTSEPSYVNGATASNINNYFWFDDIHPTAGAAVATFFSDSNYQGESAQLSNGTYTRPAKDTVGDNRISSVKVPIGLKVTLHDNADGSGESLVLTEDRADLGHFNDKTSSITVELL